MTEGGGTRRPLDHPWRTAISQNSPSATGTTKPSAGRAQRASRPFGAGCSIATRSAVAVIATGDTAEPSNATVGRALCRAPGSAAAKPAIGSVGHRHEAVVDQVINRLLDVD